MFSTRCFTLKVDVNLFSSLWLLILTLRLLNAVRFFFIEYFFRFSEQLRILKDNWPFCSLWLEWYVFEVTFTKELGYRIFPNKRRPRKSAAFGTEKLISAAVPMQRLFVSLSWCKFFIHQEDISLTERKDFFVVLHLISTALKGAKI